MVSLKRRRSYHSAAIAGCQESDLTPIQLQTTGLKGSQTYTLLGAKGPEMLGSWQRIGLPMIPAASSLSIPENKQIYSTPKPKHL